MVRGTWVVDSCNANKRLPIGNYRPNLQEGTFNDALQKENTSASGCIVSSLEIENCSHKDQATPLEKQTRLLYEAEMTRQMRQKKGRREPKVLVTQFSQTAQERQAQAFFPAYETERMHDLLPACQQNIFEASVLQEPILRALSDAQTNSL